MYINRWAPLYIFFSDEVIQNTDITQLFIDFIASYLNCYPYEFCFSYSTRVQQLHKTKQKTKDNLKKRF